MAETKKEPVERTIHKVNSEKTAQVAADRRQAAKGKRIAAIVFWVLGIVAEVFAIMLLSGYMYIDFVTPMTALIALIVIDLVLVIIGSQFWKKANDMDPASKESKGKYFLQNQMGLIVAIIAFCPLIIVLLSKKDLDPKLKKVLTVVAVAALALASVFSIDFNPTSAEELEAAEAALQGEQVYWTQFGKSYHLDPDCSSLTRSKNLWQGTIDDAFAANRNDPCDFCVPQEK